MAECKKFILVMEADGNNYKAALYEDEVAGDPLASKPFTADVDNLIQRFRDDDDIIALGTELYCLVEEALADFLAARLAGDKSRLLLDVRDSNLQKLPWESIRAGLEPLFTNPSFPICRLVTEEMAAVRDLSESDWPLRMLVVVASEEGDEKVEAEKEVFAIIDAVVPHEAAVDWKIMLRPDSKQILDEMEVFKPHIFHFIGHGSFRDNNPVLKLWKQDPNNLGQGEYKNWSIFDLSNDLTNRQIDSLRLAYINACRTAESAEENLWNITNTFLSAGTAAVIGTHAEITGSAAAKCAGVFYEELFKDLSLDVAMARARGQMGNTELRDWATPCLESRLEPAQVFSTCRKLYKKPEDLRKMYWDVRKYVGRKDIFRRAWEAQLPDNDRPAVIKGQNLVGKTAATRMLLERCLLADHEVRKVDMTRRGNDYVAMMRATLEGDQKPLEKYPHKMGFPQESKQSFEELIEETIGTDLTDRTEDNIRKLFEGFRKIVEKAVPKDKQLLIIFDQLEDIETQGLIDAIRFFMEWYNSGSRIHILFVIDNDKERELSAKDVHLETAHVNVLTINPFEHERYHELADEYVRRLLISRKLRDNWSHKDVDEYLSNAGDSIKGLSPPGDWTPQILDLLEQVLVARQAITR